MNIWITFQVYADPDGYTAFELRDAHTDSQSAIISIQRADLSAKVYQCKRLSYRDVYPTSYNDSNIYVIERVRLKVR